MILFVGNFLSKHGLNPTSLELLASNIKNKYQINLVSDRENEIFRLVHMFSQFYRNILKIDLVIIDTYSTRAFNFAFLMSLICRVHKRPYILVLSGGNLEKRLLKSSSFKFMLINSEYNISPSKYLFNIFKKYNPIYLPNYLDLELYPYKERTSINPKILWVRSIHKIYNPTMAVIVLHSVIKDFPEAHLCMVGPAKDNSINEVNNFINKFKLSKHITITGKLNKKDWIELSSEYDIFINTTNYDNHPITLLESMALGLPIVSTNPGGIPDLLSHNQTAKLVKPNDVSGMASQIIDYLLHDHERIQIAINARKIVEENFSKEKIIPKWSTIIDGVIK